MRLPPLAPDTLQAEHCYPHDDKAAIVEDNLKSFFSKRDDGALVGPFPRCCSFYSSGLPSTCLIGGYYLCSLLLMTYWCRDEKRRARDNLRTTQPGRLGQA